MAIVSCRGTCASVSLKKVMYCPCAVSSYSVALTRTTVGHASHVAGQIVAIRTGTSSSMIEALHQCV